MAGVEIVLYFACVAGMFFLALTALCQIAALVTPWGIAGNVYIRGVEFGDYQLAPNLICMTVEGRSKVRPRAQCCWCVWGCGHAFWVSCVAVFQLEK